jgi:tetratricopeptide (TPR) repeat protein
MKKIIYVLTALVLLAAGSVTAADPAPAASGKAAARANPSKNAVYVKAMASMRRGINYEQAGNFKMAFYEYSSVLKSKIKYPQVYKRLANCYYAFANYEFAIKFYKKYLEVFPDDASVSAYIPKLVAAIKAKENTRLGSAVAGAEFKSPFTTTVFSQIGLMPPAALYQGYGSYYARNRNQNWFPVSSSMSILGEFSIAGAYALHINAKNMDPLIDVLYNFGAYMITSAFVYDYLSAPFIATESSEEFIWFAKNNEMKVEEKKVEYRDPAFTSLVSFIGGSVVPGAGHFYAGDTDTALKILIFTPLVAGSTIITGAVLEGNSNKNTATVGRYVLDTGLGIYGIMRLVDLYGSLVHTDQVNEEYYKQLVCPNSPFVLKQKLPEKEPWLAFLISLVPVPGLGNLYAENYWMAGTLCGAGLAGGITYLVAGDNTDTGKYIKYGGLVLLGLTKLYDIVSAPGYTAIYNAVYTGRQERERTPQTQPRQDQQKVSVIPSIMPNGAGVNIAYSF